MRNITATIQGAFALLILIAGYLPARAGAQPEGPTAPPIPIYLPLITRSDPGLDILLSAAWVGDTVGAKTTFLTGSPIRYVVSGVNQSSYPGSAVITWTVTSACTTSVVYSNTISLQPGAWEHAVDSTVPACRGISIVTVDVTSGEQIDSLSTLFVAFPPSSVIISNQQGFDICTLPTVGQMQTWWNSSPYDVFNIYLGGVAFACRNNPLNTYWLDAVSQQGWKFILTWVGPQAPCSGFRERMSADASTAYQQGRSEADLAFAAATQLGFMGQKIIYYDMEAYSNNASCRATVDSFISGWTVRLHELGAKAGGYGSPCTSYLSDWANNNPPPDDVWIAYWLLPPMYRSDASVWVPRCLSDGLWSSHQRLRQYAGGHSETWGGTSLVIDSNALDGEITSLTAPAAAFSQAGSAVGTQVAQSPPIQAMTLLTTQTGWIQSGGRLYWTDTGGDAWREIVPDLAPSGELLGASFLDEQTGWLVYRSDLPGHENYLAITRTRDGGLTWQTSLIPASNDGIQPVANASLDFLDANTGWLSLKLQSSSSFSLGRLFFTQDGGNTWQERSLPIGEPVAFLDATRGWVAGGASGEALYRTTDGGRTWLAQSLPGQEAAPGERWLVGLPQFISPHEGSLPVTRLSAAGSEFALYATRDGGESWQLASVTSLEPGVPPGGSLPFSLAPGGSAWLGSPDGGRLYGAPRASEPLGSLSPLGMPPGILSLDFADSRTAWALVQEGICLGDKLSGIEPLRCTSASFLLATQDGGRLWRPIALPRPSVPEPF